MTRPFIIVIMEELFIVNIFLWLWFQRLSQIIKISECFFFFLDQAKPVSALQYIWVKMVTALHRLKACWSFPLTS